LYGLVLLETGQPKLVCFFTLTASKLSKQETLKSHLFNQMLL